MEKYESKQHQIRRPAAQVYTMLSDFTNFTPLVQGRVEEWHANENSCSFRVQGITMKLMITDKEPVSYVKITGGDGVPLDFTLWIQLKEVAPYDTRMRLVLHADLNLMMKMMLGSKLRDGVNMMAEQIANAFNGVMPPGFDPEKFKNFDPAQISPENFNIEDMLADNGQAWQSGGADGHGAAADLKQGMGTSWKNDTQIADAEIITENFSDELDGQPIIFPDPSKPVS